MPDLGSSTFSQTDANNNSGTMPSWSGAAAPSTLDDAGRALQGAVTREWNWRSYTLTAGGTADAKTLTYSVAPASYYNGQRFAFIANTTNTTSATLNVNALGAKTIKKVVAGVLTNLSSGDMVSGAFVEVAYNLANDCFVWTGAADSPYFTSIELGNASDTTITRASAGVIAVEGVTVPLNSTTSTHTAQQIELGNASDTTITRSAAGVIAVEGGVVPKENRANTFTQKQLVTANGDGTIQARATGTSNFVAIEAQASDYESGPSFRTTLLRQHSSAATGTTSGLANANLGMVQFQNCSAALIGTNGGQPIVFATVDTERMRIDGSGNVLVTGSGGLGYGTGSGGTVTQITSKATGVTINKTNGQIITHNASLGAASEVSFTVTNSTVAATDNIILTKVSGGTATRYQLYVGAVAAGSFVVSIRNVDSTAQSDVITFNFAVIKSVTS